MPPEAAQVKLKVYSISAQEVATLASEQRDVGIDAAVFDTRREKSETWRQGLFTAQQRAISLLHNEERRESDTYD